MWSRRQGAVVVSSVLLFLGSSSLGAMDRAGKARCAAGKAILWSPLSIEGRQIGEPGQRVTCSAASADGQKIDVVVDGTRYTKVDFFHVIPNDPEIVMPLAYMSLVQEWQWPVSLSVEDLERRHRLAVNVHALFPRHPLGEEIKALECEYAQRLRQLRDDGKESPQEAISCLQAYLRQYPDGSRKDRFEWDLVRFQNWRWEYEGFAEPMVKDARVYEEYLRQRPRTTMAGEIRLRVAQLYWMAYESIQFADAERYRKPFRLADGKRFLARAVEIYEGLTRASDVKARAEARVALYHIRQQNRCWFYPSPTSCLP